MLNKLQEIKESRKSTETGFTIIEVMIVLAIAGMIILIVLLAVPALQRNSRNTAIKNDVTAVSAAVNEYRSNNEGQMPNDAGATAAGVLTISGTGTSAEGKVRSGTTVAKTGDPGTTPGAIVVLFSQKCTTSTGFGVTPNNRSVAILYNVETSSAVAPRCLDA